MVTVGIGFVGTLTGGAVWNGVGFQNGRFQVLFAGVMHRAIAQIRHSSDWPKVMNQSMDMLQYQNQISGFISTAIFFRRFIVAVDFIQSVKISPCHITFPPLGKEQ